MQPSFNNLRVLVLGKHGQLATELAARLSGICALHVAGRESIDIADEGALRKALRELAPEVIFNAAAYTAVDAAEKDQSAASAINAEAPGVVAEEALRLQSLLVHYSTDYVFDGNKPSPYLETDAPAPVNVYGQTKLAGERAIQQVGCAHMIFRVSWLYAAHGRNFLRTIMRIARENPQLRIVDDQVGSPTSAAAVAEASIKAVQNLLSEAGGLGSERELYHMSGADSASWCTFARAIVDGMAWPDASSKPAVLGISTEEYGSPARRPRNSLLDSSKLFRRLGIRLDPWQAQLQSVLAAGSEYGSGALIA